jgi:hypothetical protein
MGNETAGGKIVKLRSPSKSKDVTQILIGRNFPKSNFSEELGLIANSLYHKLNLNKMRKG